MHSIIPDPYKLILASGSPRRKFLLETAGIEFEIRKREIDESYPSELEIDEIAEFLAVKKSNAQEHLIGENELLLTADTIVAFDGREYGKPVSREDSIEMLHLLGGQTHEVFSGVCLCDSENRDSFTCRSVVKFADISKEEAAWYFDNYKPDDKAGSYGIQDWVGFCKVEWINGSYTNILGLPLAQTLKRIGLFFENK